MSAIKLNSSGGGSITISPASTASTLTLTAPAQTGTIGLDGPAFFAYASSAQTVSNGTSTKIQINTKVFDTANCYDTTNYRFLPTVAGYYQINGSVTFTGAGSGIMTLYLLKNGTITYQGGTVSLVGGPQQTMSDIFYMNGTSDYVELYGYQSSGGSLATAGAGSVTYLRFSGALIRGAA